MIDFKGNFLFYFKDQEKNVVNYRHNAIHSQYENQSYSIQNKLWAYISLTKEIKKETNSPRKNVVNG